MSLDPMSSSSSISYISPSSSPEENGVPPAIASYMNSRFATLEKRTAQVEEIAKKSQAILEQDALKTETISKLERNIKALEDKADKLEKANKILITTTAISVVTVTAGIIVFCVIL